MKDLIFLAVLILVTGMSIGFLRMIVEIFKRCKIRKEIHKEESMENDIQSKNDAQSNSDSLQTGQLLIETLKKLNCIPQKGDNDELCFEYQEFSFHIRYNTSAFIDIYFPYWMEISSYDIDKFSIMRECINDAQLTFSCKVIYYLDTETNTVSVHSTARILFIKEIPQIEDYLRSILHDLFYSRNFVSSRMAEKARSHV